MLASSLEFVRMHLKQRMPTCACVAAFMALACAHQQPTQLRQRSRARGLSTEKLWCDARIRSNRN